MPQVGPELDEEEASRHTIASPPPDFGLDDPTLPDVLADLDLPLAEFDSNLSALLEPDAVPSTRPTLREGELSLEDRHDTDPAPPPDDFEAD